MTATIKLRIKEFVTSKRYKLVRTLLGIVVGGFLGFLYYKFVGCKSGTCPITANPWSSILFGAVFGGLLSN